MRRHTNLLVFGMLTGLLLTACSGGNGATPSDAVFDVQLIEIKGATDGIPPPDINPVDLSEGYRYTPPGEFDADNPNKWQVSTYLFSPGAMSVVVGDTVTLKMFGVNGDSHKVLVQAPDGSTAAAEIVVERGREEELSFVASQPGHYRLICGNHFPTMQSDILAVSG